ncbi:MAG: hypothetical protein M3357_14470 [Actinomycetota bacterium]|nr:hypothetical protein [Actinomycetota bacterium]
MEAPVAVVTAAGTVDDVGAALVVVGAELVVVDDDVPAPFAEVEVDDSRTGRRALGTSSSLITPASRRPKKVAVPKTARMARTARILLMPKPSYRDVP